jgi:hypothetical protein
VDVLTVLRRCPVTRADPGDVRNWLFRLWGSRTRSPVLTWDFYAARSYSLMRPPSTGLRLIRFQERSVAG